MVDDALGQLADAGFDLVHAFDAHAAARTPGWERLADGDRLGLLVGNTRALWPRFVAARADPELAAAPHPLDRYTERTLAAAFPAAPIFYGHRAYADGFLPMQRLAVATGLAAMAPTHLVVHPIYGPWFALRAVVTLPGAPPTRAPIPRPCTCTGACTAALERARGSGRWQDWLAVRDACTLRAWRYGDEQVDYHYRQAWAGSGLATPAS